MALVNWAAMGNGIRTRWAALRQRNDVQLALKVVQYSLFAGVVVYLLYSLNDVGWNELINNLPQSPWFYLFFVLRFLALPVSELAVYELVWKVPLLKHFFVFVRKRVYNFAVMGYSGEGFLTLWARRRLDLSDKTILVGVKDNNLLSAFTSNVATVLLITFLAATDSLQESLEAFPGAGVLFGLAFASATTLAILVMVFRRRLIALPPGVMPALLSVHGIRMVVIIALHAAMYSAALPGAPLQAWLVFIALQMVLSRIPFIPNQDIVYTTAALTLSSIVAMPEAAVSGMLAAELALSQLFNVVLFFATAPLARTKS